MELGKRAGSLSYDDGLAGDDEAENDFDISNCEGAKPTPRGRRRNVGNREEAERLVAEAEEKAKTLPSKRDVLKHGFVFFVCVVVVIHFSYNWLTQEGEMWRWNCRQCKKEWWQDFWRWRLEATSGSHANGSVELKHQPPPPGMDWNWGSSANETDWWVASAELVNEVVLPNVDSSLGPVLQIGCGDSPLASLLYKAGFTTSEHIDVEPRVIEAMRARYPSASWPGLHFEERDFLVSSSEGGGAPPPLHRFAAVVDKAGIWDWLVEEKLSLLPRLLSAVRESLVKAPRPGAYIVATKQTPSELQEVLSEKWGFVVEATRPLMSSGSLGASAWAYVLVPAKGSIPKAEESEE